MLESNGSRTRGVPSSLTGEIWAVIRVEWRHLPGRAGGLAGMGWYLAIALLLGVYMPWRLGFEFLDAAILLFYSSLSSLLGGPLAARSVGSERERGLLDPAPAGTAHRPTLYGRVLAAAAAGWFAALVIVAGGLLAVNVTLWHGRALLPPVSVLLSLVVWSLSLAVVTAAAGARIALSASSGASAARTLRSRLLFILSLCVLAAQLLPGRWKTFFDAQMTAGRLARNVAIATPLLLLLGAALLRATGGSRETRRTKVR